MKRGDTKLVPPNGVCQYCATDEPGGGHAYQRWSPVCVVIRKGEIRKFVCCRYCYARTIPSYEGHTEVGSEGELLIYKRNGKPLPRCRQIKITRFCIGIRNDKVHFTASSRDRVLKRYWDGVKANKNRKRGHPHSVPETNMTRSKELVQNEVVLQEKIGLQEKKVVEGSRKKKHKTDTTTWELYDPMTSNKHWWNQNIFTGESKTHGIGAFTKVPLYRGECIGSYACDTAPIDEATVEMLPLNRQDYLLPITGPKNTTLFINGETSVHFSPKLNHKFPGPDGPNCRFDSAAQVHCMKTIVAASSDKPCELFVNYGYSYWLDKLRKMDYDELTSENKAKAGNWLRVVIPNNVEKLSVKERFVYNAWHQDGVYVAIGDE